jgi:hypothetical protein
VWDSRADDRCTAREGRAGPRSGVEQLRRRRLRPRDSLREPADREDGLVIRRREQDLRGTVPHGRASRGSGAAGHARRAHARRWGPDTGVLHPTWVGTTIAEGKEVREFDGREYVLERALGGDFALVKAWRGDTLGNLVYRDTARNFNPLAATAGRITIAEVEELVNVGKLDPNTVHTPGIYVPRILEGSGYEKRIERRAVRKV